MTEMHDVVEMLLTRIKDYPEDFVGAPNDYRDMAENKWKKALRLIGGVVAPHEKEALDIRLEEAKRAVYMGAALKTILSDEEPEEDKPYIPMNSANRIVNPWMSTTGTSSSQLTVTGAGMTTNSLMLGGTSLSEDELKLVKQYATNHA